MTYATSEVGEYVFGVEEGEPMKLPPVQIKVSRAHFEELREEHEQHMVYPLEDLEYAATLFGVRIIVDDH